MPNPSTYSPPTANIAGFVTNDDLFEPLHRFDSPHHKPEEPAKTLDREGSSNRHGTVEPDRLIEPMANGDQATHTQFQEMDPSAIRAAHADDLIEFLQRWSEDLDERSTRLHADMATHERRERAFRLWMQNRRSELETQLAEYQQAQSRVEAAARRFAIELES